MTNYEIANALRSTDSRSKRALLDEAAERIELLAGSVERSVIPAALCDHIVDICEETAKALEVKDG